MLCGEYQPTWPHFTWQSAALEAALGAVRHQQKRVLGHMQALSFSAQTAATWHTLTLNGRKSSKINSLAPAPAN